jgi:hypothetical protein
VEEIPHLAIGIVCLMGSCRGSPTPSSSCVDDIRRLTEAAVSRAWFETLAEYQET